VKSASNGDGRWLFAANFLKHPGMLGSVIPSSRFLVKKLLDPVDWDNARYFVEYGPGVGTISRHILSRMHKDARLLVIELNRDFVDYLRRSIDDPRLIVHHGSAADVGRIMEELGWPGFDYGFSGIPFSTLPPPLRDDILSKTRECMQPGGEFLVFQFSNRVMPHLQQTFDRVEKDFEFRNILPAHCYRCRGSQASGERRQELRAAASS
jgi:phospholipid N-methyltransferase